MATLQAPESSKTPAPKHIDLDASGYNIVNHALEVREHLGTMCAIEYLKSNNIDSERIKRVLKGQRT